MDQPRTGLESIALRRVRRARRLSATPRRWPAQPVRATSPPPRPSSTNP